MTLEGKKTWWLRLRAKLYDSWKLQGDVEDLWDELAKLGLGLRCCLLSMVSRLKQGTKGRRCLIYGKEMELRFEKKHGWKIKFNGRENARFDKKLVKCFNCKQMGHFSRECRAQGVKNSNNYQKYKSKKAGKDGSDLKAMVVVDDADSEGEVVSADDVIPAAVSISTGPIFAAAVSPQSETEFALMGLSTEAHKHAVKSLEKQIKCHQTNQLAYEEKIRVLSYELEEKSNIIEYRQKLIDQATQEKQDLITKLDNELANQAKWNNSGKNLYKLIDSSMSVRTKRGLGLDKYIGEGELGIDDSVFSIFHTNSDDLEGQPIYNSYLHLIKDCDIHEQQLVKSHAEGKGILGSRPTGKPVNPNRPKSVFAGQPNLVSAGQSNPVSTGQPNPISAGNKDKLEDFEHFDGGEVTFGGSTCKISGKGTIKTKTLNFENVLYVKELQHFNLISVSQIYDQTHRVLFTENECMVLSKDFPLPDPSMVILSIPRKYNLYTFCLNELAPQGPLTCLIAKSSQNESTLWHRRLGHVNFRNMNKLNFVGLRGFNGTIAMPELRNKMELLKEKNQTLIEAVRTMLADSFLPTIFWTEAVATACYVLNWVLVTKPHAKTPYELLTGDKPSISYLKPFGCHVTILNTWTGQAWMFDIDYLTDSLNYSRVSRTNLTAGSQSENPSNVDNLDEFKELQSLQRQEHTGKEEADRLGLAFPSLNPILGVGSATVGSSVSAGSTPPVSASSTPLLSLCASPISANRHFIFADKSHVPVARLPVSAGRSTSAGRPTDSADIHDGLTIFDCLKSGIFTSSSYDKDFSGPDANNLESSFVVSSLITKRIHTIHPTSQLIGDINSHVQTRSQVWILVTLPKGKRAIGTKRIMKNKRDARGIVCRNKARLVAQGHKQEEGIDYTDVFAPVTLFIKKNSKDIMLVQVYVDDIIFGSTRKDWLIKDQMGFYSSKEIREKNVPDSLISVHLYRSMIGCLMYLTATRLDIMFVVCAGARYQVTPKTSNLLSVKRIFKYLTAYPKVGLCYPCDSPFDLEAFSDSDYDGAHGDRKSTTGGC
nr:putative ribonuclease H-like domain-containing protein [Tanacetum cinerariifolium]